MQNRSQKISHACVPLRSRFSRTLWIKRRSRGSGMCFQKHRNLPLAQHNKSINFRQPGKNNYEDRLILAHSSPFYRVSLFAENREGERQRIEGWQNGGGGAIMGWCKGKGTKNAFDVGCFCGYEVCLVEKVCFGIKIDAVKMVTVFWWMLQY